MANDNLLGKTVEYISTKGDRKVALVLGTSESITPGTSLPVPQEGHLHLLVFSPTGTAYPKHSVPSAEVASQIPDFAVDGDNLRNVWRPLA